MILVTGAGGLLGRYVVSEFQRTACYVSEATREHADISKLDEVRDLFHRGMFDVVVHCAAYSDVDGCEKDPDCARLVNALGTRNVAQICHTKGALLVYISTDYVFDGRLERSYRESDPPSPINVYGETKLEGEGYVRYLCPYSLIVRTSGLYGCGGRCFPETVLSQVARGEAVRVLEGQFTMPTYAKHLAQMIVTLVEKRKLGMYHVTSAGRCSWFQFARRLVPTVTALPPMEYEATRPARRPRQSMLDCSNLRAEGLEMPHWEAAQDEYLEERGVE